MKRKRDRPRDNDKFEKQPAKKANLAAWALAVGLSLGILAFIAGLAIDLQMAIKVGIPGFVLGAVGGAIAAAVDRVPTNRYRKSWRLKYPSVKGSIYRGRFPNPLFMKDYYYDTGETSVNDDDEEGEDE